jgi:hypothetical protein
LVILANICSTMRTRFWQAVDEPARGSMVADAPRYDARGMPLSAKDVAADAALRARIADGMRNGRALAAKALAERFPDVAKVRIV